MTFFAEPFIIRIFVAVRCVLCLSKKIRKSCLQGRAYPLNKAIMKKTKIKIEHELKSNSPNIIWKLISTDTGLAKWIADYVFEVDGILTFRWGEEWSHHETRRARIMTMCG